MLEETVGKDGFTTISMDWAVGKGIIEALRIEDTKSSKVIIVQDGDEIEVVGGEEDVAEKRSEPKN